MNISKTDYMGWLPKIGFTYNGYHGLDRGVHIVWHGYFVGVIKPINER